MSKLDELFREKLGNHSLPPSSESWLNVEARLSKNKRPVIWLRWAAIFLLGALLTGLIWIRRAEVPAPAVTKASPQPGQETEVQRMTQPSVVAEKIENKPKVTRSKKTEIPPVQLPTPKEEVTALKREEPAIQTVAMPVQAVAESAPIVLVYTLASVETPAKPVAEQAIAAETGKKDLSLKRMLDFASTVKNSDSPLENLRNAKEDLFAFELKKKTINKKQ